MIASFTLQAGRRIGLLSFEYTRMFNAGYTGRDQEEVIEHVRELAAKGIPGPASTPTLYPVVCHSLMTDAQIDVYGAETSGEVEYVLLIENETSIYVALGSDHTDRFLEKTDIPRAKQICPNMISSAVWRLDDLRDHWDDLILRSFVIKDGREVLYQEGKLEQILSPEQLMGFVRDTAHHSLYKSILYSGTLSLKTGDFVCGEGFRAELADPHLERTLGLSYSIRGLAPLSA